MLSDPTVRLSRPADRARVVARLKEADTKRRQNARDRATRLGLPLRTVSADGRNRKSPVSTETARFISPPRI
jgi:hypothetical protein